MTQERMMQVKTELCHSSQFITSLGNVLADGCQPFYFDKQTDLFEMHVYGYGS
jgi:hypothetical protein